MGLTRIEGTGEDVYKAAADAAAEDAALLAAVRDLPLPPGADVGSKESENDGGNVQLVRALNALLPGARGNINGNDLATSALDGGTRAANIAATQNELGELVQLAEERAKALETAAKGAREQGAMAGRMGDSVDRLALDAGEAGEALAWAVRDANALAGAHFAAEHELHSFSSFLRSNPVPKRAAVESDVKR